MTYATDMRDPFISLPMYARPELSAAHDVFWQHIAAALGAYGIQAPPTLLDGGGLAFWQTPNLLFSQTCGMPYRRHLQGHVQIIATPDYGVPGCPPGYYRSVWIVRADDPRRDVTEYLQGCFAYNETGSQSGFYAAQTYLGRRQWFAHTLHTGAHRASARAVAQGRADIACLDAVTWALMQRYDPFTAQLRALTHTPPTPGLPYITGSQYNVHSLRKALQMALTTCPDDVLQTLMIKGIAHIPAQHYLDVDPMP
ncbi:MAG: PhnD/SsuA/transferrin family substrate-binding protein [Pseudomonadota bacterium]